MLGGFGRGRGNLAHVHAWPSKITRIRNDAEVLQRCIAREHSIRRLFAHRRLLSNMPAFVPVTRTAALTLLSRPTPASCTIQLHSRGQSRQRSGPMAPRALSQQDELKQQAAWKAVEYVKSGMKLGLGTGSTAAFAVDRIGDLLKKGELKDIIAVPTSIKTREQAESAGPLSFLILCRHQKPCSIRYLLITESGGLDLQAWEYLWQP